MLKKIAVTFVAIILLSGCSGALTENYGNNNKHLIEFEKTMGDKVFFALNRSTLSAEAEATLTRQAEWLVTHKLFGIIVEGHADERGTREYNIALGERRAETVKRFFAKHGIEADRIDTISYGKEKPAVIGNNEDAWKRNRRAVIAIK